MLRAYVRKLKRRCRNTAGNVFSTHTPPRPWVASAFAGFIACDGDRGSMLAAFAAATRRTLLAFERWSTGDDDGSAFAATILDVCTHLDDGNIWHEQLRLRSYVDVSVQVLALRVLVDHIADVSRDSMPLTPIEITELLLEHRPSSRPALLVHAAVLIDAGDAAGAIEASKRALRVQAVCTTAQEMLIRAYRLARAQGATDPELEVLDDDVSDRFCHMPFTHMSTGFRGSTFACSCPAWVPFSIGDISDAKSPDDLWNSPIAIEIRRSILDGDFRYCSRTQCSFLRGRKLPRKSEVETPQLRHYIDNRITRLDALPRMLELNHDPTCNLACPSCRTEIISENADATDVYAGATERVILPMLRKMEGQTYITGGGEAFASKHFRSILRALNRDEFPGLGVFLITNGLLLTPHRWSEFPKLPEMLDIVAISVDAARGETYEVVRRPGKWTTLTRNLERMATMRRNGEIKRLGLNFVVQKANFREMLDFVALADAHGADQIWFQRAVNYGAWDEATFADLDVSSPSHPDHAELLQILRNPVFKRETMNAHMLLWLLPEFVASEETPRYLL